MDWAVRGFIEGGWGFWWVFHDGGWFGRCGISLKAVRVFGGFFMMAIGLGGAGFFIAGGLVGGN